MSTKVYRANIDVATLAAYIDALRDQTHFALLERPDSVQFPASEDAFDLTEWPSGRVCSMEEELRWEQQEEDYCVILTRSNGTIPSPDFAEVLTLDGPEPQLVWYYLWGEDEMAIGSRLHYSRALPGQGRGQVGVIEYRDQAGRLLWYRYLKLKREGGDG